jgi:hypothetical protein
MVQKHDTGSAIGTIGAGAALGAVIGVLAVGGGVGLLTYGLLSASFLAPLAGYLGAAAGVVSGISYGTIAGIGGAILGGLSGKSKVSRDNQRYDDMVESKTRQIVRQREQEQNANLQAALPEISAQVHNAGVNEGRELGRAEGAMMAMQQIQQQHQMAHAHHERPAFLKKHLEGHKAASAITPDAIREAQAQAAQAQMAKV